MATVQWALHDGRPRIEVALSLAAGGDLLRSLVADTGAGTQQAVFELILDEDDCLQCGGIPVFQVQLGGAYSGSFPVYLVDVRIAQLNFDEPVPAVGVSHVPDGFGGLACFKFLNRFHYGNFGDPDSFGLDHLPP